MTTHRAMLELAAAAIDFELTRDERDRLAQHLSACPGCRHSAGAMGADAQAFGTLPVAPLADDRGGRIIAAVLRPPAMDHPLRLVLVAAILALLAVGSLLVGSQLMHRTDDLIVVEPAPSVDPAPEDLTLVGSVVAPTTTAAGPVLAYGRTGWVVGEVRCSDRADTACPIVFQRSVDGLDWMQAPDAPSLSIATASLENGADPVTGLRGPGLWAVGGSPTGYVAAGTAVGLKGSQVRAQGAIWHSNDGVAWERVEAPAFADVWPRGVFWSGSTWFVYGVRYAPAVPRVEIWTSDDGRTWTPVDGSPAFDVGPYIEPADAPMSGLITGMTIDHGVLLGVGSVCTGPLVDDCRSAVWRSEDDGATWSRTDFPDLPGRLDSVFATSTGLVAFGHFASVRSTSEYAYSIVSPDGRAWSVTRLPEFSDLHVAAIGNVFLAVEPRHDPDPQDYGLVLFVSVDGRSWRQVVVDGAAPLLAGSPGAANVEDDGGRAVLVITRTGQDIPRRILVFTIGEPR